MRTNQTDWGSFGKGGVYVVPHPKKYAATVEEVLDGEALEGVVKVGSSNGAEEIEDEFKPKYLPFPVSSRSESGTRVAPGARRKPHARRCRGHAHQNAGRFLGVEAGSEIDSRPGGEELCGI